MFERLHIYTVHLKKDAAGELIDTKLVREGFNWWAFLLNVFWALYQRCWLLAALAAAFIAMTEMLAASGPVSEASVAVIQLGCFVIIGLLANDELRAALSRRGYVMEDVVSGDNSRRGLQRFFDRYTRFSYP